MKLPTSILDVFCCLVGVLMVFNIMSSAFFSESPEKTLPPVELATAKNSRKPGLTKLNDITLSVKPQSSGDGMEYFIENEKVDLSEIPKKLLQLSPYEVILRIDKEVRHGDVIHLMELCKKANIHNLSFAYRSQN